MYNGQVIHEDIFQCKQDECIQLLTNPLYYIGIESLDDLDAILLELVLVMHEGSAHVGYPPLTVAEALISAKKLLLQVKSYEGIPPVVNMGISDL